MLSFASAVGNLMNRIGKLGLLLQQERIDQLAQLTNMTDVNLGVVGQFNSESDIQALMGNSYLGIIDSGPSSYGGIAQSIASATVNRMVFRDNPQLNNTLQGGSTLTSLLEIIRQMKLAGATVLAMTIGSTPTAFIGTGNGIIVTSTKRPLDGLVLENSYAETLKITCSADSYSGGAVEGNEALQVTGVGSQSNVFSFDWPLGSNCSTGINSIDGNTDNGSGNILTNSGFDSWSNGVPDNWTLLLGTTSNIAEETGILYDGTASLGFIGDAGAGDTNTTLVQSFGTTPGTSGTLFPQTQYSVNLFLRRDGVIPGAGVLTVDLVDNGFNTINDLNGVPNSFDINLTQLNTVFTAYNGCFRTPTIFPPSAYYLRLRLSTPLTNNRVVYVDKLSMGVMSQLYTSGPFIACHSGSIPFVVGDYATCAITNSRGAGGVLDTFQTLWGRLFSEVLSNELLLPSSNVPTVSDGLIG